MTDLSMPACAGNTTAPVAEPSDLDVAIGIARRLLNSDQVPSLREALRLLLRALGSEPADEKLPDIGRHSPRCPAAHPEDSTPCSGPAVVMVLDRGNAGARGCEHHAARLLASLQGGRVYALENAPAGAAIRTFKAAGTLRPFAWEGDSDPDMDEALRRVRQGGSR